MPTLQIRARRAAFTLYRYRKVITIIAVLSLLETLWHIHSFNVPRPSKPLDPPFSEACAPVTRPKSPLRADETPPDATLPGHNPAERAAILMLARNKDAFDAAEAVRALESRWNKHYHYPYVFLNDEPFSDTFTRAVEAETSGSTTFATIPAHMWSWPRDKNGVETPSRAASKAAMARMAAKGLPYASADSYHHMCRFYSGLFVDHPALAGLRYFWRLDPDVRLTCDVPYDVFRMMRAHGKKYGYGIALWEIGSTAPSLFRHFWDFAQRHRIPASGTWTALMDASWAPQPFRKLIFGSWPSWFHSRTPSGDAWNMCHFWSNFEVGDLDFFRSDAYRAVFAELDAAGGFYTERWGDAPVHSLAAAMLLDDVELHHFADVGYVHYPLQQCPVDNGLGCRCQCDPVAKYPPTTCLDRIRQAVEP